MTHGNTNTAPLFELLLRELSEGPGSGDRYKLTCDDIAVWMELVAREDQIPIPSRDGDEATLRDRYGKAPWAQEVLAVVHGLWIRRCDFHDPIGPRNVWRLRMVFGPQYVGAAHDQVVLAIPDSLQFAAVVYWLRENGFEQVMPPGDHAIQRDLMLWHVPSTHDVVYEDEDDPFDCTISSKNMREQLICKLDGKYQRMTLSRYFWFTPPETTHGREDDQKAS